MTGLPVVKNSLESYLTQINQFPLLTQEEEFKLATRYRKDNDIEAAQKLITSNLRFVVKVAFEYKSYEVKLLDLIQEGNIGLMMAVKKINPYKGYRFISLRFRGSGHTSRILLSRHRVSSRFGRPRRRGNSSQNRQGEKGPGIGSG